MKIKSILCSIIITFVMTITLIAPCYSIGTGDNDVLKPKTRIEKKSEAKSVLKKFFKSMVLVGGSCVVIFLLLFAYKRLKSANTANMSQLDIEKNLNTPETVEEATKFVIEKF